MFSELRCPSKTCYGWASEVEESANSKFYGCGSCGSVWKTLPELFDAIERIISKYKYRKKVYVKSQNGWHGVELIDEPEEYEDSVISEWADE